LIRGPAASGKSRAALDHFLADSRSALITPTATMAGHVRNQLARAGLPVRPSRVRTFAQFLDRMGAPAAASRAALHLAIEAALDHLRPARFQAVAEYRGFRAAVAALLEVATAGSLPPDLEGLREQVAEVLAARGMAMRGARLDAAAQSNAELPSPIVLDGFFSFSAAELSFIESLALRTRVIVTLPDGPGAVAAQARLLAAGFAETRVTGVYRTPLRQAFCAPAIEQETEEIARRIVDEAARGRPFRDMGILLRVRDPYAPALETTLARFGIPARLYFADSPAAHPAIDFIARVVRALLDGWDHLALLRVLRMPVSGLGATPQGDRFDFNIRERLPGRGLPLPDLPADSIFRESLPGLTAWLRERLAADQWVARLKTLRGLIPAPVVGNQVSAGQWEAWRSTAAALDCFDAALDETGAALSNSGRIPLAEFWRRADAALELTEFRAPYARRDVVHVLDVVEARQWELPVVFVCGMIERHFPQYHREDPLLGDAGRRRAGLKTSSDLQREERSLFDLAVTRATEQVILSYPRFDENGEATLPSLFLEDLEIAPVEMRVRPRSSRSAASLPDAKITDGALLQRIAQKHRVLSPTSVESFLQCPFRFFAGKTLRLRERPPAPRDRLDMLAQGNIVHTALAAMERMPLLGAAAFDLAFAEEARLRRIPATYRTEAVRLELLRHFTAFVEARRFAPGWTARVEEAFEVALSPSLAIRGRIDRLEIGPGNQAVVIDYKYSAAQKIRERVKDIEMVQAGLYLLAAEKQFGLVPAGMLYCGLKKNVEWGGWHLPLPAFENIGTLCTREELEQLTGAAAMKAAETFDSILSGRIEACPRDKSKCAWCDYRDICRIETQ